MSPAQVKAVMASLNRSEGHPLTRDLLLKDVNIREDSPLSSAELADALEWAISKGFVDYSVDAFRTRRYYITPQGKLAYRENFA